MRRERESVRREGERVGNRFIRRIEKNEGKVQMLYG